MRKRFLDHRQALQRSSRLGACRTLGVEAKFAKTEDSFFRIRSPIAQLWGKKAGKNGPVSRKLQPTFPKSDRLLASTHDSWIGERTA